MRKKKIPTHRSPSAYCLQLEHDSPNISGHGGLPPCSPVSAQLSSCVVNSCLLQPYSIVKVGDGAGEGRRLFYSTWHAQGILEHFITKTGLPTQRALRTPWSHAQPLNSLASRESHPKFSTFPCSKTCKMAHLKLKPKDTASEPIKTQGSLLYSEGQGARPSSSQAQIPFHTMHTAAVLSWDGYLGKGLRAGGLEKQDAFPLTRAILTQRLKQACSVPLPPGWESPCKTGSFSQWHPALAKDSLKPKLPRRHANSQEEAREAPNAAGVTQQEGRWLLAAAGDLSGC